MFKIEDLAQKLVRIDGSGYKAYKDIQGSYEAGDGFLFIDHVQADPYAPPSKIRLRVPIKKAGFPDYLYEGIRVIALEDIIARRVRTNIKENYSRGINIDAGQQQVLKRTAAKVTPEFIEVRMTVGLPATGRRIQGREAKEILCQALPEIARQSLVFSKGLEKHMAECVYLYEDQDFIREELAKHGLAAFVANGSVLPRKSGNSDLPMLEKDCVVFQSPASMEVEMETVHHGTIKGMGIPRGVTLIVGGGYHGKSTLLKSIERGIYNHIRGDGREWIITSPDAVKIRAEDGRNVEKVDIRYFIDNLPLGQDTREFSTANASGSTSQAANIVEAIETGADLLLLDEDTSATNFMIRDARMQKLITKEKEPITPFVDRVRPLYEKHGISTILVIGGAGDYLDTADRVIMLDAYRVYDVTDKAREVTRSIKSGRVQESQGEWVSSPGRVIKKASLNFARGDRVKVSAKGLQTIMAGREIVDLGGIEQLLDSSQTRAIAECLRYMEKYVDGQRTLKEVLDLICRDMNQDLAQVTLYKTGMHPGELAMPRRYELAAAINRLRTLQIGLLI